VRTLLKLWHSRSRLCRLKGNRLHKLLKQYGVAVQESAFEARLEKAERKRLIALVGKLIDATTDRFVMYPIARDKEKKIIAIGTPRPDLPAQTFFIV